MGLYRDSALGLCVDVSGPAGNVFVLISIGNDVATQLGTKEEWKQAVDAAKLMGGSYMTMVNLFKEFFPVVTVVGLEVIDE